MIKSNNTLFSILGSKVNYFFLKIKVGDRALIPAADFVFNYFKNLYNTIEALFYH